MSEWVAIQRNPFSGSGSKFRILRDLICTLKQRGLQPRLFSSRQRLADALNARRSDVRCVVAAGGDGTVGDVLNRYPGVPMTVCPLGTENLFAKYLGIPRDGDFVGRMIADGRQRHFDVGELTSQAQRPGAETGVPQTRRFLLMASFGFDADVVHRVHAVRRGQIRKWSYVRPIWQSLRRYPFPEFRLELAGETQPRSGALAVVSNLPAYAFRLPVACSADGTDGRLDVRLFERPGRWNLLRYAWSVWWNRHEGRDDVQSLQTATVKINADVPVPVQADGDPAGYTPAEIRILTAALQVIVPA